jgi:hypothetical protein
VELFDLSNVIEINHLNMINMIIVMLLFIIYYFIKLKKLRISYCHLLFFIIQIKLKIKENI